MRKSLIKSVADSSTSNFERYPKGSIVLCQSCSKPVFKLERGVDLGDKAGRAASAFKPLNAADLTALEDRRDIDPGVRALIRSWTPDQRVNHLAALHEMRAGDPMMCPVCHDVFVQVLAVEKDEVLDKAYTIELVTIPPSAATGRLTGASVWVH